MNQKSIILLMASPVIVGVLGVGGYFLYGALTSQTDKNNEALASFGEDLAPAPRLSPHVTGQNELNAGVVSSSLAPEKQLPVEKVIAGLKEQQSLLVSDNKLLQQQIETLKQQIAELEEYKRLNQRFAPETIAEELKQVSKELRQQLLKDASVVRYNNRQVEMMTLASVERYHRLLEQAYAQLTPASRATIVASSLAEYAFCVGDGIELAANSAAEERALINYFRTSSFDNMSTQLRNDLSLVITPCDKAFAAQTVQYLP